MKKLLILMVAFSTLYSCSEDSAADVAPQSQNPQIILAPKATTDVTDIVAQVGENTVNVDFGFEFASGTTYYGRDVDIEFDGEIYTIIAEQGTDNYAPVGNIDYTFNVPAPSTAVPFGGITTPIDVDLSATDYSYSIVDRPSDLVILKGNGTPLTLNANLYRALPQVSGDDFVVMLDWDDENSDIDINIVNETSGYIEYYSWFGYPEEVAIPATAADAIYTVYVSCWTNYSPTGNISYQLFTRQPNGELSIYDGTMINPSSYWGTNVAVIEVTKTGTTYDVTEL